MTDTEIAFIDELERHVLTCCLDARELERRHGEEGWLVGIPCEEWKRPIEHLVELGLMEHQDNLYRISEQGESLLAQIEATEQTKQ